MVDEFRTKNIAQNLFVENYLHKQSFCFTYIQDLYLSKIYV